jgi:hypothetical protein
MNKEKRKTYYGRIIRVDIKIYVVFEIKRKDRGLLL